MVTKDVDAWRSKVSVTPMISITCEYPLPDPGLQEDRFRTHDLGYGVAHYCLTADGRLVWQKHDPSMIRATAEGSIPVQETEDMNFHGSFRFGTYRANERIDFCAQFVRGKLQSITRIDRRFDDDYDVDVWPGLADAAEGVERRRLINQRRLLRNLEELEPEFTRTLLSMIPDRTKAAFWLATPNPYLGDVTPYRALALGRHDEVLALVRRAQEGIYI